MAATRWAGPDLAAARRVRDPRKTLKPLGSANKEFDFIEKRDLGQRLPPGVLGGAAGR